MVKKSEKDEKFLIPQEGKVQTGGVKCDQIGRIIGLWATF